MKSSASELGLTCNRKFTLELFNILKFHQMEMMQVTAGMLMQMSLK